MEANPAFKSEISVAISQTKVSDMSSSNSDFEDLNVEDDKFYDAASADSSSSEESDDEETNDEVPMLLIAGSNDILSSLNWNTITFSDNKNC